MSQAPSDVYARQLLPKQYGYPLFVPEPYDDLPAEYRDRGTSIGDVGIIMPNGSFSFVLNICAPMDDPVNCYGVPEGFEQVNLVPGDISLLKNMHKRPSDVFSAAVRRESISVEGAVKENELLNIPAGVSVGYSFSSASSEAAVLTLPEGAASQDLRNLAKFRRHALKHTASWYEFVNGTLGREAPNGSLYLVTGCDKSTAWGIASVSCASETNALSLKFTVAQIAEASATYTYSWETYCPATVRTGPEPCENTDQPQNQCVFLRGFKLAVREGAMAAFKGATKLSSILNAKPGDILPGSNGSYIPFMDGGKRSWSGKNSGHGGSGGQQRMYSLSVSSDHHDTVEGIYHDKNVLLEFVPGTTELYHPLNAINKYLLDNVPHAQVVVTHESDWWVFTNDRNALLTDDELLDRLHDWYRPCVESGGVFLVPKYSERPDGRTSKLPSQSLPSDRASDRFGLPIPSLQVLRAPVSQPVQTPSGPRGSVDYSIVFRSRMKPAELADLAMTGGQALRESSEDSKGLPRDHRVAVKVPKVFHKCNTNKHLKEYLRKTFTWWQFLHSDTELLYTVFLQRNISPTLYILSPRVDYQNVKQRLNERSSIADRVILSLDIAKGLEYIHGMNIVHGSLTGANVLISWSRRAFLADPDPASILKTSNPAPEAPELRNTWATDILAFGLICYTMFESKIIRFVMEGEVQPRSYKLARSCGSYAHIWHLIQDCCDWDPQKRPAAAQIVKYLGILLANPPVYQRLAVPSILPTLPPAETSQLATRKLSNTWPNFVSSPTTFHTTERNMYAPGMPARAQNVIRRGDQDKQAPEEVAKNWPSQRHSSDGLNFLDETLANILDESGYVEGKPILRDILNKDGLLPRMRSELASNDANIRSGTDLYSNSSRRTSCVFDPTVPLLQPPVSISPPSSFQVLSNFFEWLPLGSRAAPPSSSDHKSPDLGDNHAPDQPKNLESRRSARDKKRRKAMHSAGC